MFFNVILPMFLAALFVVPFFAVVLWIIVCAALALFDSIRRTRWENKREKAAIKAARAYQQKMLSARFGKEAR